MSFTGADTAKLAMIGATAVVIGRLIYSARSSVAAGRDRDEEEVVDELAVAPPPGGFHTDAFHAAEAAAAAAAAATAATEVAGAAPDEGAGGATDPDDPDNWPNKGW